MVRKTLPDRRTSWTQKVKIEGQTFYLTCSEYPDGKLGEIWLEAQKENTFTKGILGALAREISISIQNGTEIEEIINSLRFLSFPPNGEVTGEMTTVKKCTSVPDWVAQEIELRYLGRVPQEDQDTQY